jgi:hypothetical protein
LGDEGYCEGFFKISLSTTSAKANSFIVAASIPAALIWQLAALSADTILLTELGEVRIGE